MSEVNGVEKMWLHWIEARYALADLEYETSRENLSSPKPVLKVAKSPSPGWPKGNVNRRAAKPRQMLATA